MPPTFNAIDVETANADRSTICQIGIAHIRDGVVVDTWKSLINPEDDFDWWNIEIHGITEEVTQDAPTLPEVRDELRSRLLGSILVSHTSFDRVAFERAMDKYRLDQLDVRWLDSAKVVRRAWPEKYSERGYGLGRVARDFGIDFQHHDALEDARVSAEIMLLACAETGLGPEQWIERVARPIVPSHSGKRQSASRPGNPDGPLYGEVVVFTGKLNLIRQEAADLAAQVGCRVRNTVNKRTTMLVLGMQDKRVLNGQKKSSKHRQAEKFIESGTDIQILSEEDFLAVAS